MLSSSCVFLKKKNRKAAKLKFPCWTITFPNQVPHWKSIDSAEPQTLCKGSQLWVLCSEPLGLLMDITVTELLFRQNLMSRRRTCQVLFSVLSSLPPWLVSFFAFPSLIWSRLFCCLFPWCPATTLTWELPLNIAWDLSFPYLWLCYFNLNKKNPEHKKQFFCRFLY